MKKLSILAIVTLTFALAMTGCDDGGTSDTDRGTTSTGGTNAGDPGTTDPDAATSTADATSSSDPGTTGDATSAAADSTSGGTGTTGGGGSVACEIMDPVEHDLPAPCTAATCECGQMIQTVIGKVVDGDGAPLPGSNTQVCIYGAGGDDLVCLTPVPAGADGTYTVAVPADNQCVRAIKMRVTGPTSPYSTRYCKLYGDALTHTGGVLDLTAEPATLFGLTSATNLPSAPVTEGVYTVTFEGGLEIDLDVMWYFWGDVGVPSNMSAEWLEGTDHLCDAGAIAGAPGIWSISPAGDVFKETFAVRIPAPGLDDGAEVNLFVQGGINLKKFDENGEYVECAEGVWTHFGCATVQGGVITLDATQGLPSIGALAYVPVPVE